jgi:oxalate decarboxylase/phosphoglucose isomerase-like protein (cupin superfamily)
VVKKTRATHLDDIEWSYSPNPKDQGRAKTVISRELNNSDDLRVGLGWLEPDQVHILHHHTNASEFYYILIGSAKITVGDQVVDARAGTAVYIPAGDGHKIVNDGAQTLVVLFGYNRGEYDTVWDE